MNLHSLIANYANFNLWANETLVRWLRTKPAVDLGQEVASSHPSLLLTLDHISQAEHFWHRVVTKTEPAFDPAAPPADPAAEAVFSRIIEGSKLLVEHCSGLSEADLLEVVVLDSPWVKGSLPRYEFLQHVFNHGTYHRGQVTSIGRRLGYTDAPMTDYNFYNMMIRGQA